MVRVAIAIGVVGLMCMWSEGTLQAQNYESYKPLELPLRPDAIPKVDAKADLPAPFEGDRGKAKGKTVMNINLHRPAGCDSDASVVC
ncbi:MAG: hypothetical protein Rhob2KO_28160 [Rhodopirellula baltica]